MADYDTRNDANACLPLSRDAWDPPAVLGIKVQAQVQLPIEDAVTHKMCGKQPTVIRDGNVVENANALDLTTFSERFLRKDEILAKELLMETTGLDLNLALLSAMILKNDREDVLQSCFELIEQSSAEDYRKSEIKWSPSSKRKEMILPDMRYLILRETAAVNPSSSQIKFDGGTSAAKVCGFVSFMITYEDGYEVVYVYEIHLAPQLRSRGVGTVLMELVESVGRRAGVSKCMLTVFKANKKAVRWYEYCGYTVDDFSPGPRILRNGTVKEPSYQILSKDVKATPH